jgi:hypothetical protein
VARRGAARQRGAAAAAAAPQCHAVAVLRVPRVRCCRRAALRRQTSGRDACGVGGWSRGAGRADGHWVVKGGLTTTL